MIGTTNADGSGVDNEELTAYRENVLNNKLFLGYESDEPLTGTMPDNGTTGNQTLNCGGSFTVKRGFHAKEFKINANSLASQTSGNANATQILKDKVAWINGQRVVGTMPDQGAKNISLKSGDSWTIVKGFHNGSGKVNVASLASQTSATSTASNILSGKTAWVNGSKITGTIQSLNGQTVTPSTSQQTIACANKYMTSNIIIRNVTPPPANCIKKGYNYMGVTGTWEGYVPTNGDLYLYGNDIAGFSNDHYSSNAFVFQTGQIDFLGASNSSWGASDTITVYNINLKGYNYINVLFSLTRVDPDWGREIKLIVAKNGTDGSSTANQLAVVGHPVDTYVINKTMSISLTELQIIASISFYMYRVNHSAFKGNIKRIWLS